MAELPGRADGDLIAGEQAALRRVATLVARGAAPEEVFAAITEEAGRLLSAGVATMGRYKPDGARTVVGAWSSAGPTFAVGSQQKLGGRNVPTLVFQTGRPARIDDNRDATGPIAEAVRSCGLRAGVAVPVSVEGELWGEMAVGSRTGPLPAGTEAQLAGFTELAATAIANAQARVELRGFADEQAALRRVATLVARGAPPEAVFAAVTEEAGRLLGTDYIVVARYDPDATRTVVGSWSSTGPAFPIGRGVKLGGRNVPTLVFQTHRPGRIDDYLDASGPVAEAVRDFGLRATVGVPVSGAGALWGVMIAGSRTGPLPAGTETQLTRFTELAATAIANAQARVELRAYADEQAALQRVATLVARGAAPSDVLTAVTGEAGQMLHADVATMNRYSPDGALTVVAAWSSAGASFSIGLQAELGGRNLQTIIFQTHKPARIDDYDDASGRIAEAAREFGLRGAVGVPVSVEGRLWGVMVVGSRAGPMPAGTEVRLAGFTELAGTAIANADAQAALTASRARIVATADATRRRIERNLHDGAQQRLVSLALNLRAAQQDAPPRTGERLDQLAAGLDGVLDDLREIARGLPPALTTLARRSPIPVSLDIQLDRRLPEPVETAAYYTVAEALTNAAKHAHATAADIQVAESDGVLHVRVRDNGRGGADFSNGTGLVGLRDRAEALGGHLQLHSPAGAGTTLEARLPFDDAGTRGLSSGPAGPPITSGGCAG
jgi:GAF domain-containing protein